MNWIKNIITKAQDKIEQFNIDVAQREVKDNSIFKAYIPDFL